MYADAISALADQAVAKLAAQRRSIVGHFVRSMLAGMYVGAAIVLIFTIGAFINTTAPGAVKLLMGVCFGGALTIVIFAGSELFTGSNLVLTLGVLSKKASPRDLASNWIWTWLGNLAGSMLLAVIVIRSGVMSADPVKSFVLKLVETKMNLPVEQLFWRAVLANWLVCLGVWMAIRTKEDIAKILLIWWCMFTFITCGYEHSIANMCGLFLGILLPHGDAITWGGYWYNLALATFGNVIGGAGFVGMLYWLGSPKAREASQPISLSEPVLAATNGAPHSQVREAGLVGSK
ncbi:MAG TPA: formate/nitrite transporter family protein [Pirellulales bacterium]|jgi:nitrite transporter NirC|nr:formate/nitrite transporter family protein [Pirellulales bacterium]